MLRSIAVFVDWRNGVETERNIPPELRSQLHLFESLKIHVKLSCPQAQIWKLDWRGFVYRQWKCYWRWQLSGSNRPLLISNPWFEIYLGNSQWTYEMHSVKQECSSVVLWIKCLMRNIYPKVLLNTIPLQLWRLKEQQIKQRNELRMCAVRWTDQGSFPMACFCIFGAENSASVIRCLAVQFCRLIVLVLNSRVS